MIYYIDDDGKTVLEIEFNNIVKTDPDRMFAVHPDDNSMIHKAENGRYVYTNFFDEETYY